MNRMLMLVMNNVLQGEPTSDSANMQQNENDAEHEMDDFYGGRSEKRSEKEFFK